MDDYTLLDHGGIDVYLINTKTGENFHFPINPIDKITENLTRNDHTQEVVDKGEFDIFKKGEKLEDISFKAIIPEEISVDGLKKSMLQKEPLRLIITRYKFNDLVVIKKMKYEIEAGLEDIRIVNFTIKKHREIKLKSVDTSKLNKINKGLNKTDRSNNKTYKTIHKIVRGDTLWGLAQKNLGKGSRWKEIYALNKDIIKNPCKVPLGTAIKIPKR